MSPATGHVVNLHAYRHGMFGGYSTFAGAIFDGFANNKDAAVRWIPSVLWLSDAVADIADPDA